MGRGGSVRLEELVERRGGKQVVAAVYLLSFDLGRERVVGLLERVLREGFEDPLHDADGVFRDVGGAGGHGLGCGACRTHV